MPLPVDGSEVDPGTRYVALLRGINVGGHRVKMDRLRQVFCDIGLEDVRSYINSGNVFFAASERDTAALTRTIESALHEALGYEVPAFLRTPSQLRDILDSDPFAGIELTEDVRFCVVFTSRPLDTRLALPIASSKDDMDIVAVNEFEAFVVWRLKNGRPPSGKFPEEVLPARNTTRFFHTLEKILVGSTGDRSRAGTPDSAPRGA